ncbi:MAG: efflux RND transporter permease subunit [Spirochaetaceae bacterium]|jgi:HAE1 family hydrophobic/amphiphilic exporter-1|nr:efflux RND transporter permease subunit [Spirochaetaceae bacterium]
MSIAKSVISRPVTFFIIFVLFVGLGIFALFHLPIDLLPEINPPYIMVMTTYAGAGPEEVERSVTRPLEQALSSVSSLEKITSSSSKGSSQIVLQFTFGTNLIDSTNMVRDAIERIKRLLPDTSDAPLIIRIDPSMMPVASYMVSSEIRSPEDLYQIATDTISTRMEQSPGVASATVNGGRKKIIRVDFPESRLEAYNLTITQIQQMIAAQNTQIGAGTVTENNISYILTTMGEYTSLEDIRKTVISYVPSGKGDSIGIFLGDIANVYEGYQDATSAIFVNGQPAIGISIQKQSGTNSVSVVDDLRARIPGIQKALPGDIKISETYSTTDMIKRTIGAVISSVISGVILAVLVLFVFFRQIKPTLVIAISMPVSMIVTIMLMYFAGLTLNLMTLAGLYLGLGMLVDNSIVVLENIYHYREKGAKLRPAAILGTTEMIVAISASTLTTIVIFAPLIMFQSMLEVQGEMFAGLAFTIVISLAISLLTAIFLVPILCSHFFPLVTRKQKPLTGPLSGIDRVIARFLINLENNYRKIVDKILRHKLRTIIIIFILFAGAIALVPVTGYVFMPQQEQDSVNVRVTLPLGTPIEETSDWLARLEEIAKREVIYNGEIAYKRIMINVGGGRLGSAGSSNSGTLQVILPDYKDRKLHEDDVKTILRRHFNDFPGAIFQFQSGWGGGGMGGNPVDIMIKTDDLKHGKEIADQIVALLKERIPEATEPQIDMQDGLPQLEIELDRQRMYALGLNAYNVGNEIKAAVDGLVASKYSEAGTDYDIVLRYAENDRNSRPALDHVFVKNSAGKRIPVSNFAGFKEGIGPVTIKREGQSRVIHITAGVLSGTSLNVIEDKVRSLIAAEIPAEDDLIIEFGGDSAEMQKTVKAFMLILLVAVFLVFGVMAAQFESFKDPFIILFTIPLSIIGVVAIYLITGDKFNVLTAVGILVLIGVIVNNGIVLVDYTNLLRKRGYSLHDACVEAAGNRLRPILMSTLTTVLGLAPLAFLPGEGTELVAPIGKTVFGGLTFGTLMTLFLMPTVYAILNKHDDARKMKREARREGIALGLKGKALREQTKETEQHILEEEAREEEEWKAGDAHTKTGDKQ